MLDLALRCYQRLGWTYLRLTVLSALLCLASYLFVTVIALPALFVTRDAGNLNVQLSEAVISVALALFVGGPLFLIGLSWSSSVVCQLVADTVLGNVPSATSAVASGWRAIGRVIGVNLYQLGIGSIGFVISVGLLVASGVLTRITASDSAIAGVVSLVGILAMIVAVIFFLMSVTRYALAPAIAVLEGATVKLAIRRSTELQKAMGGHPSGGGAVWGLAFMSGFVFLLISAGIGTTLSTLGVTRFFDNLLGSVPGGAFLIEAVQRLPAFLAIWTIIPFWAAALTILYFERRVRLEGYDIDALAAEVWRTDHQARFEL